MLHALSITRVIENHRYWHFWRRSTQNPILLLSIAVAPSAFAKATLPNDDGGGKMYYLDRHKLDCGTRAIQSFRLYRPTSETIGYSYRCGRKSMGNQTHEETRANKDGKGNVVYLDRQKSINCGGRSLTAFQLFRPTKTTIAYKFSCGS